MPEWLRQSGGVALLVVGVAGCLLPVMPGIPFIVAGVAVLGTDHALVRPLYGWLQRKGMLKGSPKPDSSEPKS